MAPTPAANAGVYIPPHLHSNNNSSSYLRNGVSGESRYSKDQMVDIYKAQRDSGALDRNLEQLFSGGWNPFEQRDEATSSWERRDKGREQTAGPEICWNPQVDDDPLSLLEMTDSEKEVSFEWCCSAAGQIAHSVLGICDVGELSLESASSGDQGKQRDYKR